MSVKFLQVSVLFSVILFFPIGLYGDEKRTNVTSIDKCQQNALQNLSDVDIIHQSISLSQDKDVTYSIIPEENEIHVHWKINLTGQPLPDLFLLANNEVISNSSTKYTYELSPEKISLIIKNASEKDANLKFDLFAENCVENKTVHLEFNVNGTLSTNIKVLFLNSTHSRLRCEAVSVSKPDVFWFVSPCSDGYCYTIRATDFEIEKKNLQLFSYFNLAGDIQGFVRCSASNSLILNDTYQEVGGKTSPLPMASPSLIIILTDVPGGIDIFGSHQIQVIDVKTKQIRMKDNETITLTCGSSAYNHTAKVRWAKHEIDNEINDSSVINKYAIFSNRQELKLPKQISDRYFCKAWTKNGVLEYQQIDVIYGDMSDLSPAYYVVPIFLVLAIASFVAVKMKKRRKLQKEDAVNLQNFESGALELLNPNLDIGDQANLLPYDKDFEFPLEKLKLGTQIGSGAFGIVIKGEAAGILEDEENTTVAVKMVNGNIGDVYISALISELKILIHLGRHINVVNLLGACTRNIQKKELLVIVEYCEYGNLKDYLLSHRQNYIDQINPETGQIDFTVGRSNSKILVSNDLESSDEAVKICTKDLLAWSFQVARGMEYLSTRKVLHGDLAARNILLAEDSVVKICDFGLAKRMYERDCYQKTGDDALPLKWMAVEAITDKIFSTQSDVWSFGVVLWEFFTLAKTPYPGIEFNSKFYQSLIEGYRMEKPEFATQEIYEIMLQCWYHDPLKRPSFAHLTQRLGLFLEDSIRNHYIDMNGGYVTMNAQKLNAGNPDYLLMVDAPNFEKYTTLHRYVNVAFTPDGGENLQV